MQSRGRRDSLWAGAGAFVATMVILASPAAASGGSRPARSSEAATPVLVRQVALRRAGFSVGPIDGRDGPKTRKALAAWQAAHPGASLPDAGPLRDYAITEADAAGPFAPSLPTDMMELGSLKGIPYRSLEEMLAERFATTPALLTQLNPSGAFAAGKTITVPDVEPMDVPPTSQRREMPPDASARTATVRVSKAHHELVVTDVDGAVVFYAPVSSGSEHDPLPIGTWKVIDVFVRPLFNYNPDLFWDADPSHAKTQLPGGPNSPVGLVWIDLDKEHYGLHGTPAPETVGVAQSHGCVRLTNWDALRLASLVRTGTAVHFEP